MIANLIGGFVAILIGVSLLPTISKQIGQIDTTNLPLFQQTLLKWVPGLFAFGIIGVGIAVVWNALRQFINPLGMDMGEEYKEKKAKKFSSRYDREWEDPNQIPRETPKITPSEIKVETHGEDYFK